MCRLREAHLVHNNYRRKYKYKAKHHGHRGKWWGLYSLKPMKTEQSRKRRARERFLMSNRKFDMLTVKVHRDIIWNYW